MLKDISFKLGLFAGGNPITSIFGGLALLTFCSVGWVNMQFTDDPQDLWVPPSSTANLQQNYVIEKFGAFFRINTIWITPAVGEKVDHDLFQKQFLNLTWILQSYIEEGKFENKNTTYGFRDFCYKPITGEDCLVTSPMQYWKSNVTALIDDNDVKETSECIAPPGTTERVCFDKIGTPVMQFAIFGGAKCVTPKKNICSSCKIDASGLQITFLLYKNDYSNDNAKQWEKEVFERNIKTFNKAIGKGYHDDLDDGYTYNQELLKNLTATIADIKASGVEWIPVKADYLAERGIEDNIALESSQNTFIVVASYLLMFVYVGCAIGHIPSPVHSKFSLGFSGIFVVIISLVSAIGITFYLNFKLTMISAEVVPFLILAIGVDNMFLISRAERLVPEHVVEPKYRVAFALKEVGPSIFVAAFCEALAFAIGMQTDIPALQSFCMVAGLAVVFDFIYQICIFLPALTLDKKRVMGNRYDIFCCIKKQGDVIQPREDVVRKYFNKHFVPFVFKKTTKMLTIFITICLIVIGNMSTTKILRGLNQNISFVSDSALYDYFEALYTYGDAGPPAYVIFNNVNYTNPENLGNMSDISAELSQFNDTIIAPIYSWVGPFQNFINTGVWSDDCGSDVASLLPFDDQMRLFTKIKIDSTCCQKYGICGEQYSLDIIFDADGKVETTRFRFQHQPLKYQIDFINALFETRKATEAFGAKLTKRVDTNIDMTSIKQAKQQFDINDNVKPTSLFKRLSSYIGLGATDDSDETEVPTVFCYSLFYVYYDQYTYITGVLAQNIALGMVAIFFAIQILSSIQISIFISFCVFLVFFELMGFMWLLNEVIGGYPVEQNAIFVVNLVTSLGFGVEFCNHIGMNFMRQTGTREERAKKALSEMGSSVLVGIATTKFIGVFVLIFAPSTLFKLYYFRMYLFIIIFGVFNGLMFLPTMLSLIGPAEDKAEIIEAFKDRKFFNVLYQKMQQSGKITDQ